MAILDVLTYPDERLKQTPGPVAEFDDALRRIVSDLQETMDSASHCVGLAATQLGIAARIALVDVSKRPKIANHGRLVLINPEIKAWEGLAVGREGCLSVPDYTGNVIRAERIDIHWFDEHGEEHEARLEGFEARAVQHEVDHLNGLLFLDRLVSHRNDLFRRKVYKK
ncbi:MAG TPA: peptide deformylase [Gammaproteobacteria bacterium]|nr:peptide deformylase [Gammaproteobacteria bacterium]